MLPPKPLNYGSNISYFEFLLNEASPILNDFHFQIDITGYSHTIDKLNKLTLDDYSTAWELSQELNSWSDYLSDILSNCRCILRNLETDKMAKVATASANADSNKVANGDRLANKDDSVISIRKKRNCIESLCELLDSKIQFLERSHYLCKKTFEWNQTVGRYENRETD